MQLRSPRATQFRTAEPPSATGSVLRLRDFRLMFIGAAVSKLGSEISFVALPLAAVLTLRSPAGQIGLLGAAGPLASLLIGLPTGVWVDRVRRRGVLIAADCARFILFGSIPAAWWLGVLSLPQLFIVAFLAGGCTCYFDVAAQSYLPHLVEGRERLVDGNAKLSSLDGIARIIGRALGGYLVGILTAPVAIAADATSYLWSAACVGLIRRREPAPDPRKPDVRIRHEISEGIRYVQRNPILRAVAYSGAAANFFIGVIMVMLPVLLARNLGLSGTAIGLFMALGGVGALLAASVARTVARFIGYGRALWINAIVLAPTYVFIPLANRGVLLYLAGASYLLFTFRTMVDNVIQVSLRQRVTPDGLLGRMNATMRFLMFGAVALGSLAAGLIAQYAGVRTALWVGVAGLALAWLPVFLSPLRRMWDLPPAASG